MFCRASLLPLAAAFFLAGAQANPCPPTASTLPSTKSPSDSNIVKETLAKIQADLTNLTSTLNNGTGIAIGVKSIHEDKPLFEYYHTPAVAEASSTKEINIDTVFRGGSITKIFTVLSALQNPDIKGSDPVTKYLPQLKRDVSKPEGHFNPVPWDNITVDDLASHVSGIGRDIALDLAVFTKGQGGLGLPSLANETRAKCSGFANTPTCTKEDLLDVLNKKPLVFRPHTAPAYTNIGISLLGLIVEAATNKTWDAVLNETILQPLGLTNTSTTGPASDSWGFIPKNEPTWGADLGIYTAAGGIYTNTRDMLSFGTAVLSNKLKIDSASWLKPRSFTSSSGVFIGAPWEIQSSTTLLPYGVPIYIYTKAGDLGTYSNVLFLIPDFDIVVSILTAGPDAKSSLLFPTQVITRVFSALIPALEKANKEAAAKAFAGTYTDPETNSSLTISTDDGPGLSLSNLTVRGFDVLPNINNYNYANLLGGGELETSNFTARIYPTNLKDGEKWSWRAIYKDNNVKEIDNKVFFPQGGCQTWAMLDAKNYNYLGIDEFTVSVREDGTTKSISPAAFGVTLTKTKA